jgi:hypothetical protein
MLFAQSRSVFAARASRLRAWEVGLTPGQRLPARLECAGVAREGRAVIGHFVRVPPTTGIVKMSPQVGSGSVSKACETSRSPDGA